MVKAGYKQTAVGEIPEDWQVLRGREITTTIAKGASPKWQGFSYTNSGMLFVTSENVRNGYLDIKKPKYLPIEFHEKLSRSKLKNGDILINLVGASIGRSCQIRQEIGEANINQAVAIFRVGETYEASYIASYLNSPQCIDRILGMQVDAARPNISLGGLRDFPIPLPSRSEQKAIADTLSDVDALIGSLEALIGKKRDIKTATMQQLLTGKKRLPGFGDGKGTKQSELGEIPEDWDAARIGDTFDFKNGINKAKMYFGRGTPIVNYMDVFSNSGIDASRIHGLVSVSHEEISNYSAKKGDVFFTRTSETVDEIGIASVLVEDIQNAVFSGFILRARERDGAKPLSLEFKKYCFQSEVVRKQVRSTSSYTTRALTNGKLLSEVHFLRPRDVREQEQIARAILDMESEISSIRNLLQKTKSIKQGMMQELLTGRTRLV
jgi:type I restriction enzyme, S subunit